MNNDFSSLANMIYSGRSIAIGMTPDMHIFAGYALTGRSESSQARNLVLGQNTGVIFTKSTKPGKIKPEQAALVLYPAIMPVSANTLVVSNGVQTNLLYTHARHRPQLPAKTLQSAFATPFFMHDPGRDEIVDVTTFEPDRPNYTPRINACIRDQEACFHIVYRQDDKPYSAIRIIDLQPGSGRIITTYSGGNEELLLPFTNSSLNFKVDSRCAANINESLYEAIYGGQDDDNYRVASTVVLLKGEAREVHIINRSERGD